MSWYEVKRFFKDNRKIIVVLSVLVCVALLLIIGLSIKKRLILSSVAEQSESFANAVKSANEIENRIKEKNQLLMEEEKKAIDSINEKYNKQKNGIVKSQYESESDFDRRKQDEIQALDKQQDSEIAIIGKKYSHQMRKGTLSDRLQLHRWVHKQETIVGDRFRLSGEYDSITYKFDIQIIDTLKNFVCGNVSISVKDKDIAKRNARCMQIESDLKTGKLIGYVTIRIRLDKSNKVWTPYIHTVGIKYADKTSIVASSLSAVIQNELNMAKEKNSQKFKEETIPNLNRAIYSFNGWINWLARVVFVLIFMIFWVIFKIHDRSLENIGTFFSGVGLALLWRVAFGIAVSVLKWLYITVLAVNFTTLAPIYVYFIGMFIIYGIVIGFCVFYINIW